MIYSLVPIFIAIVTSTICRASVYETQYLVEDTTDQVSQSTWKLRWKNHTDKESHSASDWFYGVSTSWISGGGPGYDYDGNEVLIEASWKAHPLLQLEIAGGFHRLRVADTEIEKNFIPLELVISANQDGPLKGILKAENKPAYSDLLLQPGGATATLSARSLAFDGEVWWTGSLRTLLRSSWSALSDDNQRSNLDLSTYYGFEWRGLWLGVGIGGTRLSFSRPSYKYWSPGGYLSLGPRAEAVIPVFKTLRLSASAQAYRFVQDLRPWAEADSFGMGGYGFLKIQAGAQDALNVQFTYETARSKQTFTAWSHDRFGLSATAVF